MKKKTWDEFKEELQADFQEDIKIISKDYEISEDHSGCYLCNFEDQYICLEYNGGCKGYEKCKEIHKKEKIIDIHNG